MNLIISFFLLFLFSCSLETIQSNRIIESNTIIEANTKEDIVNKKIIKKSIKKEKTIDIPFYLVGDPYFIEGVKYTPTENYNYNQNGLATFYGPELHKKRTQNNSLNNVIELLGRHKTLPLPSVIKITNLENGLSLIIKINDRHNDNTSIIQVSRKVAQLLRFYKSGIAQVNLEVLSDPSKQLKIVTNSMNSEEFNTTIKSAPTEKVSITDLGETDKIDDNKIDNYEQPIQLGNQDVIDVNLYVIVSGFSSYQNTRVLIESLNKEFKTTTQSADGEFSILFGPIKNNQANNLVSTLISKGYKNTKIIIE